MMRKTLVITSMLLFIATSTSAQSLNNFFKETDTFFKQNVTSGLVNYKQIHKDPSQLNTLISKASQEKVPQAPSAEYKAFWVNMYNLLVIKEVINHYPIKSPLDVGDFFKKGVFQFNGKNYSLNEIEHKLLRAKFNNDARLHFVLVCAGLGCPPIIAEAYLPSKIEEQLTRQTKLAVNNQDFIKVNNRKRKVELSQLFEWYAADFKQSTGSFIGFLNEYRTEKVPAKFKTTFYQYNWNLNISK